MGRSDSRTGEWAAAGQRIAAARRAPTVTAALLSLLAVAEQIAAAVGTTSSAAVSSAAVSPAAVSAGAVPAGAAAAAAGAAPAAANSQLIIIVVVVLCLGTTVPAALARSQPAAAALIVATASVLSLAAFQTLTVAGLIALLILLYRLGRTGSQLLAAGLVLPFLALALALPARAEAATVACLTVLAACLGPAAAWAGAVRRSRTEAVEHSAVREAIAGTLLEHTARGERARISRELHDVVAHHISMIAVQAETARLTTPGMPAAGAQRLSAIGDTARSALTEMRRLLGVLREDVSGPVAQRRPQPGLTELNELLDEARAAAGTGTRLIVRGWQAPLDPGVELAAYRIVQEALTNARRHAPGAAVDVELRYHDDTLQLRVRDNGPGPPDGLADGHGLLGMRERAAAVGGLLRTSGARGGGFLVEAWLPAKAEQPG